MASVFIDMLGFLMVLPHPAVLRRAAGRDASQIGLLIAAFSFAQLATSPLWGKLSDRWGRRPVLLVALAASGVAFIIFALADSLWMLFLSRLAQGAGGGTTGVAQAYVSDSVGHEERAKALGWLSAATNAGVMLGPALGALATTLDPRAPGFVAAGLCFLNVLFAWRWLPESSHAADRVRAADAARPAAALKRVLREPGAPVSALIWIYAAGMMAFFALNGVLALYLGRRFGVNEKTIGWFYFCVGAVSLLMRTAAPRPGGAPLRRARRHAAGDPGADRRPAGDSDSAPHVGVRRSPCC